MIKHTDKSVPDEPYYAQEQEPYNYKKHTQPERGNPVSNTVPDQNYSIQEILQKFTRGEPINNMVSYNEFDGDYDNNKYETPDFNNYMPAPQTLDLVDRQRLAKTVQEQLKGIEDRKAAQEKAATDYSTQQQSKIDQLTQQLNKLEKPNTEPTK